MRKIVERFVTAWERNDVDAVVELLVEDARMTMPPLPSWYRGRAEVAEFLRGLPLAGAKRWRLTPVSANGQLAFAAYLWVAATPGFRPHSVTVLTLRGEQIEEMTAFLDAGVVQGFGLPVLR